MVLLLIIQVFVCFKKWHTFEDNKNRCSSRGPKCFFQGLIEFPEFGFASLVKRDCTPKTVTLLFLE